MSRSAKDATRFTATVPHAYSRTGGSPSSSSRSAGGSPRGASSPSFQSTQCPQMASKPIASSGTGETPSQKVARLRAEHARLRMAQMSRWDKFVVRGRRVADRLHTLTVFGLLSLSAVTAGITLISLGDMILYNRRKKKEFTAASQRLWEQRHEDAVKAQVLGTATETQLALIKQEQDAQEYHGQRDTRSWSQRIKGAFVPQGLSKDATGSQAWKQIQDSELASASHADAQHKSEILSALDQQRTLDGGHLQKAGFQGGPLDQMAEQAAAKVGQGVDSGLGVSKWFIWGSKKT